MIYGMDFFSLSFMFSQPLILTSLPVLFSRNSSFVVMIASGVLRSFELLTSCFNGDSVVGLTWFDGGFVEIAVER